MNLQGRDLKQDLTGDDVKLLHAELTQLGLPIPDAEKQHATFAAGTREAVMRFQKEHGLPTTGVVEATTARAINQVVAAQNTIFVVSGTVFSAARAGVGGLRVIVVDKNAGPDVPLV